MPDGELTEEELAALLGEMGDDEMFGDSPISDEPPAAVKKAEASQPGPAAAAPQEEKTMSQADIDALLASMASDD